MQYQVYHHARLNEALRCCSDAHSFLSKLGFPMPRFAMATVQLFGESYCVAWILWGCLWLLGRCLMDCSLNLSTGAIPQKRAVAAPEASDARRPGPTCCSRDLTASIAQSGADFLEVPVYCTSLVTHFAWALKRGVTQCCIPIVQVTLGKITFSLYCCSSPRCCMVHGVRQFHLV